MEKSNVTLAIYFQQMSFRCFKQRKKNMKVTLKSKRTRTKSAVLHGLIGFWDEWVVGKDIQNQKALQVL